MGPQEINPGFLIQTFAAQIRPSSLPIPEDANGETARSECGIWTSSQRVQSIVSQSLKMEPLPNDRPEEYSVWLLDRRRWNSFSK